MLVGQRPKTTQPRAKHWETWSVCFRLFLFLFLLIFLPFGARGRGRESGEIHRGVPSPVQG